MCVNDILLIQIVVIQLPHHRENNRLQKLKKKKRKKEFVVTNAKGKGDQLGRFIISVYVQLTILNNVFYNL